MFHGMCVLRQGMRAADFSTKKGATRIVPRQKSIIKINLRAVTYHILPDFSSSSPQIGFFLLVS